MVSNRPPLSGERRRPEGPADAVASCHCGETTFGYLHLDVAAELSGRRHRLVNVGEARIVTFKNEKIRDVARPTDESESVPDGRNGWKG